MSCIFGYCLGIKERFELSNRDREVGHEVLQTGPESYDAGYRVLFDSLASLESEGG